MNHDYMQDECETLTLNMNMKEENVFPDCEATAMYVLQQQPLNQNPLYLLSHSTDNNQNVIKIDKRTISQAFEGQSFPFRLWHLINNDNFYNVIQWSPDGKCIVFPNENEFVASVLKLEQERIFKTESMKSFVRQLNLYGFHKVQLEKDETFRHMDKENWPNAVFEHPFFQRDRPHLLERVKRRCKVKQMKLIKAEMKKAQAQEMKAAQAQEAKEAQAQEVADHDMLGTFGMEFANNTFESLNQYITQSYQVVPQSQYSDPQEEEEDDEDQCTTTERKQAKRRLDFSDCDDDDKIISPQPVVDCPQQPMIVQYASPFQLFPFYMYPQTFINHNYPAMIPTPEWPTQTVPVTVNYDGSYMAPCTTENVNFLPNYDCNQDLEHCHREVFNPGLDNIITNGEDDTLPESYLPDDNNDETNPMSPIYKFLSSCFNGNEYDYDNSDKEEAEEEN